MSAPQLYIAKSGARNAPGIPLEAVTRTFGIFGQRGTGKTNTAVVLFEEMVRRGGHVVIFDPVGAWWGITHDGEGKGLPGVVIGGEHADVPLEETGGHLVADLIVGRHWPVVVVDMKLFRKGQQRRFMADCIEDVYLKNREPLHVGFEEADTALPQNARGMDPTLGRLLGAAEDMTKYGRGRGLGVTLISQRFATVNANVREQVETLILMRLMGPLDQKAAKGWIQTNGDPAVTTKVIDSMASLKQGEGWMYSPGWLELLERLRFKHRRTFDSSATPEIGQTPLAPGRRAPVDLGELRERMADTVERAKANDPKALRARVVELEKALAKKDATGGASASELAASQARIEELEREVERLARLGAAGREIHNLLAARRDDARVLVRIAQGFHDLTGQQPGDFVPGDFKPPARSNGVVPAPAAEATAQRTAAPVADHEAVNAPRQKILDTIAWFEAIGVAAPRRAAVGPLAGSSATSSGFEKNLSGLRTAGLIEYPEAGRLSLTAEGRDVAQTPDGRPTNADLHAAVLARLNGPRGAILEALLGAYPEPLSRADLAAKVGVSPSSSGFEKNLSGMRTLELIDYPGQGMVVAADLLFI